MLQEFIRFYKRFKKGLKVIANSDHFFIYPKSLYAYHNLSFSQEGEDLILARFFSEIEKGFYVDIGAHHPQRFSNTYYFYLRGWRGINIDPVPDGMKVFDQIRPEDINLEIPISNQKTTLTYYQFNESALNSFCKDISKSRDGLYNYKIVSETQLKTYTLVETLDKYLPIGQKIDFLTIDVEGMDYQVLESNNWQKYRPKVVLVEDLKYALLDQIHEIKVVKFMQDKKYALYAKTVNTLIFISIF